MKWLQNEFYVQQEKYPKHTAHTISSCMQTFKHYFTSFWRNKNCKSTKKDKVILNYRI